jgi:methyl-accepting chemotaxis protein
MGLRWRVWLACLGGAAFAAGGMWWVIGTQAGPDSATRPAVLLTWLAGVAGLAIVVGAALALWLERVLVIHLKGLSSSLASGQVTELRGLPAAAGWGELSELTQRVQLLVTQHRQATRAVEELSLVRLHLDTLRAALARWKDTERWPGIRLETGPVAPVAEMLQRGIRRVEEVREQNEEAARKIGDELSRALDDARASAEQAEKGFVEATALLTTVRELQRLGAELEVALEPGSRGAATSAEEREIARSAIEELVASSSESVGHLARGVVKVQEIADEVQVVANRATLVALNAALGGTSAEPLPEEMREDMRALAAEVRSATERTTGLAREVEREARAATERMRGVRERVAGIFERLPEPMQRSGEEAGRLLERVREMVQDATQKGERLSAAGESASRAADRLVRGLEEEAGELMGLVVRLAPPAEPHAAAEPRSSLRLLGQPGAASEAPRAARPQQLGEERS